jgi:hypothetical protein
MMTAEYILVLMVGGSAMALVYSSYMVVNNTMTWKYCLLDCSTVF